MPRRTLQQAQHAAIEEIIVRTRFLLRNRDFRRDLMEVQRRFTTDRNMESYFELLHNWDLQWFPVKLISAGDHLHGTVEGYEAALAEAMIASRDSPRVQDHFIFSPPVVASCPYETYAENLVEQNLDILENEGSFEVNVPDYIPGAGKVLDLRVDLSYPQDVLEAKIKVELSKAMKKRRKYQQKGLLPPTSQRQRLDKVDFQLAVFDLVEAGKRFDEVARLLDVRTRTLKGRLQTVRSAYIAARRKVLGLVENQAGELDHVYEECPVCSDARHPDHFCPRGKASLRLQGIRTEAYRNPVN